MSHETEISIVKRTEEEKLTHYKRTLLKITDIELLKKCIGDLGYYFQENIPLKDISIRTYYENGVIVDAKKIEKDIPVDIAIQISKNIDVGLIKKGKYYEVIADWAQANIDEQSFLSILIQKYALLKVKKEAQKNGWKIETEERMQDGTVKMEFVKY
jgi:hypothetical protein